LYINLVSIKESLHYVIVMSILISFSNLGQGLTSGLLAETVRLNAYSGYPLLLIWLVCQCSLI